MDAVTKKLPGALFKRIDHVFYAAANNYRYNDGIRFFEKIAKKYPGLLEKENFLAQFGLLYDHAALQQSKKNRAKLENKALKIYEHASSINPKSYRALWGIGRIWWHRENRKALVYAKKARLLAIKDEKSSDVGLYTQNVGLVYRTLKNYKRAEWWLLKGLSCDHKNWSLHLNLVGFYRLTHQYKKSQEHAQPLAQLFKKDKKLKKTAWGKKIQECIAHAKEPLQKIRRSKKQDKNIGVI